MTDTSKMGMTALIALYNEKAAALGKEAVTEFKTTKAAREAIAALDAAPARPKPLAHRFWCLLATTASTPPPASAVRTRALALSARS